MAGIQTDPATGTRYEVHMDPVSGEEYRMDPLDEVPDTPDDRLTEILQQGGLVTLNTPAARRTWENAIPEMVALIRRHVFTPEQITAIMDS